MKPEQKAVTHIALSNLLKKKERELKELKALNIEDEQKTKVVEVIKATLGELDE